MSPQDPKDQYAQVAEDMGLETNDDGKIIIHCSAINQKQLNDVERMHMRIFYWAAYHGLNKYLRQMVLHYKWSPYIKSFKNRSIVSGAIMGENIDTVRMLVGEYEYRNVD